MKNWEKLSRGSQHIKNLQKNPENYPEFTTTMNYDTGQLEVTPKKEAEKNPDRQIMTEMVQQGFFLLAPSLHVLCGTL